jgi:hypothetical protein
MKKSPRGASNARDDVASIMQKIEGGVKKRQAAAETLDPSLTVKTGDATKAKAKRK